MPGGNETASLNLFVACPQLTDILRGMSKVRYDYAEFKAIKTDEGFLIDSPIVARTGILTYTNADGSTRRELRLPEDVFHVDSLNSFTAKPITVDHPKALVTHNDVSTVIVGTILTAGRQDGENLRTDVVIHQPAKIGERRQLSLGYNVDLEETPGEWNGQRYDAIQRNIRVNHLSVVKSARAGAQARLNMDSNEEPLNTTELVQMPKVRLDNGIEYEAAPEVIVALEKLRTDNAAAVVDVQTKTALINTITGERDTLKARVDGFPAELKTASDAAAAAAKLAVQGRATLEGQAKAFKVDAKPEMTDEQVKHVVIKAFNKDFDPAGKSAEYVQACFDIAVATRKDAGMSEQRQIVNGNGHQQVNKDSQDPREVYKRSLGSNAIPEKA